MLEEVEWCVCKQCKTPFLPKFKLILKGNTKSHTLLSPLWLRESLENVLDGITDSKENLVLFEQYNGFCWVAVWYFKQLGLPYSFIRGYDEKIKPLTSRNIRKASMLVEVDSFESEENSVRRLNKFNSTKNLGLNMSLFGRTKAGHNREFSDCPSVSEIIEN